MKNIARDCFYILVRLKTLKRQQRDSQCKQGSHNTSIRITQIVNGVLWLLKEKNCSVLNVAIYNMHWNLLGTESIRISTTLLHLSQKKCLFGLIKQFGPFVKLKVTARQSAVDWTFFFFYAENHNLQLVPLLVRDGSFSIEHGENSCG